MMALDGWSAIGEPIADRLGRYANEDDGWWDKEVQYWNEDDGVRLVSFELSDLGRHIFSLIVRGKESIAGSIFNEMELMLQESVAREVYNLEHAWCAELLDGLYPEILDHEREGDADNVLLVSRTAEQMMGSETRVLWDRIRGLG